ncbi:MAG TPA: hypothetical protein VG757_05445 [Devosia sp.]|nr:hypothetical protein [Devosia sp.]
MNETPYPGLRPFRRDEVNVFFGRDRHIDAMLRILASDHFLAVTGSSGAGKSSLVKTGLYSALELGYMRSGGSHWQIVEARPQTHPLAELSDALVDVLGDKNDGAVRGLMAAAMTRSPESATEILGNIIAESRDSLLIVIDQFEELFRYEEGGTDDEKYAFVAMLLELARQRTYPIYVAITVRSDFLGECARYDGLAEIVNSSLFLTPQMNREELREAIESPALVYGGKVDPRLTNRILNDLEKERDQLPLMQHALALLWDVAVKAGETDPLLTLQTYDEVGGVTGALTLHANQILDELGPRAPIAEKLFRQLVGRSETADDVRRPTLLGDISTLTHTPIEELIPVIESFRRSDRSFLAPPEGELVASTTIDITHESLIRQWPALKAWAAAEQADAEQYRRLEESGRLHKAGKAGLWGSPDLDIALEWRRRVQPSALWAGRHVPNGDFEGAMAFLSESERVAASEREAAAAAIKAEEERRQRENQRLRRRSIISVAIALVALAGFGLAAWQGRIAAENEAQAKISAEQAAESARIAEENKLKAEENARVAQENLDEAQRNLEQAIGGQADYIVQTALARFSGGNEGQALAIAAEADLFSERYGRTDVTARRMDRLQRALSVSRGVPLDTLGAVQAMPDTHGFTGAGQWVGLANEAGQLSLNMWDLETGSNMLSAPLPSGLWLGAVTPGLGLGAVVTNNGDAGFFPLARGGKISWLRQPPDVKVYALSMGGEPGAEQALLTTYNNGGETIELWNVASPGAPVRLDSIVIPEWGTSGDYADYVEYDSHFGRFVVESDDGATIIGSVTDGHLAIDGYLPFITGSTAMRFFDFIAIGNQSPNLFVGLVDSCLFSTPLDSLVPTPPTGDGACPSDGVTITLSNINDAELVDDGGFLMVSSPGSRELLAITGGTFGTSVQMVDQLEPGRTVYDMNLRTGTQIATSSSFADRGAVFTASAPQAVWSCAPGCSIIASFPGEGVLLRGDLDSDSSLFVPLTAAGEFDIPYAAGYSSLIGVRADGKAIALANKDWTQAAILTLDPNVEMPLPISKSGTPDSGTQRQLSVKWNDVQGVPGGSKLAFSDPVEWPDYFAVRPSSTDHPIAAYHAGNDWLAVADEKSLSIRPGSKPVPAIKSPTTGKITALHFSPDGSILVIVTEADGIWSLKPASGEARLLVRSDQLGGAVAGLDVTNSELVFTAGSTATRVALNGGALETLNGISEPGIAVTPSGVITVRDALVNWSWPSTLTTPQQSGIAIATARGGTVDTETLQELYFVPNALTQSFAARFGSAQCATAAPDNRGEERGIGCSAVLAANPGDVDALLAHGLELLQSSNTVSFSGLSGTMGAQITPNVEEGELFVTAAAVAGNAEALAVLADRLSPAVSVDRPEGALLPASGWGATLDLLERIYASGGPLPSAVADLILTPSLDNEIIAARGLWSGRIADSRYDGDPVAVLVRTILAERAGADPAESLAAYTRLIPQLARPADRRALGLAQDRFAALSVRLGESEALAALVAARRDKHAEPPAAGPVATLPKPMAEYIAALANPSEAAPKRASAVVSELLAFLELPGAKTKSETPPYIELKILTEQMREGIETASLGTLAGDIANRASLIEGTAPAQKLVADALQAMIETSRDADWRNGFETAVLARYAAIYGTKDATAEQQFFSAIATVLARARNSTVPPELKPGFDAMENQVLGNFLDALDGFNYNSELLERADAAAWPLAQIADRLQLADAAATLAGRSITTTSALADKNAALDGAPAIIRNALSRTAVSETSMPWLSANWATLIASYTNAASTFRTTSLNEQDRIAQSPAQIARFEGGLDLDNLLADSFDRGGTTNYRDHSLALIWMGLLYNDIASALWTVEGWDSSIPWYQKAAAAAEESGRLRLVILPDAPNDAYLLDGLRNSFGNAASAYSNLGQYADAVAADDKAYAYAEQAYAQGGVSYIKDMLLTGGDRMTYRIDADDPSAMGVAIEVFDRVDAINHEDLVTVPGYAGWVLRDVGYALGAEWRRLGEAEEATECDTQLAHPYDPLRRAPGYFTGSIADIDAGYAACKVALADSDGLSDLDKGRIYYQLGRAVYEANSRGRPFAGEDAATLFQQAVDLGYPGGYIGQMAPLGTEDADYARVTAGFYNSTLKALGPKLVALYGKTGELHSSSYAFWITKQLSTIGAVESHRWIEP